LIESEVGPYQIKIAVEVKKEKRPFELGEMEQLVGKYKSNACIPVEKVVAVAQSGFTKGAKDKAEEVGIEMLTLKEAQQSDWTKLAPQRMAWQIPPCVERVELVPPVPSKNGKDPLADGRFVCNCHGEEEGSPLQWATWLLRTQVYANPDLLVALADASRRRNSPISATLPRPLPNHTLVFEGERYTIDKLIVHLCCSNAVAPVKWSSFSMKGKSGANRLLDHGEARFGPKGVRMVIPNGPTSEKIVLRVDNAPSRKGETAPDMPDESREFHHIPSGGVRPRDMPPARLMARPAPPPRPRAARPATPKLPRKQGVGRNDPCPCQSGKKYKNCCLKKSH
jgi:hypothetical protein